MYSPPQAPKNPDSLGCKSIFLWGSAEPLENSGPSPRARLYLKNTSTAPLRGAKTGHIKPLRTAQMAHGKKSSWGLYTTKKGETAALCFLTPAQLGSPLAVGGATRSPQDKVNDPGSNPTTGLFQAGGWASFFAAVGGWVSRRRGVGVEVRRVRAYQAGSSIDHTR